MPAPFTLTLVSRRGLAASVAHCAFVRADGQPLPFLPGQFIQIHFEAADGTSLKRSYSLATILDPAAPADARVELAVSLVPGGAATSLFENLRPGDTLQATGPFGRMHLQPGDRNHRYLLIGTGTGITPYRAMLRQLEQAMAARGAEVVLMQGARSPAELLYGDELRAFADAHPQFRYVPCFSRQRPAQPHADVREGYVQQHLAEFAPDAADDIAYLCGNPDMVDACFQVLSKAGFGPARIRREKYVGNRPALARQVPRMQRGG